MKTRRAMTATGLIALSHWIDESKAGRFPDPAMLCRDLPHGRFFDAEVRNGKDRHIALTLFDQHETNEGATRTPRLFDAAAFCAIRLLALPNGAMRIDRNGPDDHNPSMYDHIQARRIIMDAQPGEAVNEQINGHYDLRRGSNALAGPSPSVKAWKGRQLAIESALKAFDKADLTHLPTNRVFYAALLADAFTLVDMIPVGKASGTSVEAPFGDSCVDDDDLDVAEAAE